MKHWLPVCLFAATSAAVAQDELVKYKTLDERWTFELSRQWTQDKEALKKGVLQFAFTSGDTVVGSMNTQFEDVKEGETLDSALDEQLEDYKKLGWTVHSRDPHTVANIKGVRTRLSSKNKRDVMVQVEEFWFVDGKKRYVFRFYWMDDAPVADLKELAKQREALFKSLKAKEKE